MGEIRIKDKELITNDREMRIKKQKVIKYSSRILANYEKRD